MIGLGRAGVLAWSLRLLMWLTLCRGQTPVNTIRMLSSPQNCFGGEQCKTQPALNVFNAAGELDVGFVGSVSVSVFTSPGSKSLFQGACTTLDSSCSTATEVVGTVASAHFVNGVAQFQGIMIKTAGLGFVLKFIASTDGNDFAFAFSNPFDVLVGDAYRLQFSTFIGAAFGGLPFSPNPSIAIVDRGGNTVDTSGGRVTAILTTNPYPADVLHTLDSFSAVFQHGVASYASLYLNRAGGPYAITFQTDVVIYDGSVPRQLSIVSKDFNVVVGTPFNLQFAEGTAISSSPVYAGEFFAVTPRLRILDAGGNIVIGDSASGVKVAISSNPANAVLGVPDHLFAVAIAGIVTFSTLTLDKASNGFRLSFTLSTYSRQFNTFTPTKIVLISERFDVLVGPPRKLVSTVIGKNAWAGGQPMEIQPVIQVLDYGNNILSTDYSSVTVCNMVSSLSTLRSVVVDTSSTDATFVLSASINVASGTYGAGQLLLVTLQFNFEVWTLTTHQPTLLLAISSPNSLVRAATLVGSSSQTKSLSFRYIIAANDSAASLDYSGTSALRLNGALLVNGNNRSVSTALPSSGLRRNVSVSIDTSVPYILRVQSSARGEYSVGDVVVFNVTFSAKISIFGTPFLVLTALNATGASMKATFSSLSGGGLSALFNYHVGSGENSPALTVAGHGIYLSSPGAKILRFSDYPTTLVNATWPASTSTSFLATHNIIIDTSPPKLLTSYGIKSSGAGKTFYTGDEVFITISFDKAVSVLGLFSLVLQTGPRSSGLAPFNSISADNKIIEFKYTVLRAVNTSALDIVAGGDAITFPPQDAYIRRYSASPTMAADVNTTGVFLSSNSLKKARIKLNGLESAVASASLNATSRMNPTRLYVDDFAIIQVKFTTPVVMSCPAVLIMSLNSSVERVAEYLSGNTSDTILFKYTVQMGDSAEFGIRYRYSPNALCLEMGCPVKTSCTMLAQSANPSYPVNLQMPPYFNDPFGVPLSLTINIDKDTENSYRGTRVKTIASTSPPDNYGAGNFLYFAVTFTDEVMVINNNFLRLHMNTGRWATYESGSATKQLTFVYATTELDFTAHLYPNSPAGGNSPLNCTSPCTVKNRLMHHALLSGATQKATGIQLDASPPKIVMVWTNKTVSPYNGIYTVGEAINIYVKFSSPVVVALADLRLNLDLGGTARYATFVSESGDYLTFQYVVAHGDYTTNLAYLGPSLDRINNRGLIYRAATSLSTQANYMLPTPRPIIQGGGQLFINTREVPKVLYVTSVSTSGEYTVGDVVVFKMTFSHYVVLNGRAVVNMNLGDHIVHATFSGTNQTSIASKPPLPSTPSTELYFQMIVSQGDFSHALDYTDSFSFSLGKTDTGDVGTLLQASSTPSVICILDLPKPGQPGSLSSSARLTINGGTPYLSSLGYSSPSNQYGAGQKIDIEMNFSAKVVVTGYPYIVLATGLIKRNAVYTLGSGTSAIIFSYIVQPGDKSLALDYTSNRAKLQSAADSFHLNGGSILTLSRSPTVPVFIHLNPPGGSLQGVSSVTAAGGEYRYQDLNIKQRGPDYLIRFSSSPAAAFRTITTSQTVFVSFSNEFELRPQEAQKNDLVGSSVAMSGNLAMVGAPASNRSVTCVQTVTTSGAWVQPTPEIQTFGTYVQPQAAILSFHTTAGINQIVGGTFEITYGSRPSEVIEGPTSPIAADVTPTMLEIQLRQAISQLGNVTITREPYIFCACENAFLWTLTFNDVAAGVLHDFVINSAKLTGGGATIVGPTTVRDAAYLAGSFNLIANGKTSAPLPFDATISQVSSALADIDYSAITVAVTPPDASGARSWIITFDAYRGSYDIPLLSSDPSKLSGGNATVWHATNRPGLHGPGGINGGIFLEWRGNTTKFLPFNAEASAVKSAMEALPVINRVNVNRSSASSINGFVWTIEFVEVNANTARGYQVQPTQNLEPIIAHNALNGTEVTVTVAAISSLMSSPTTYGSERRGTFGSNAGAVYMFQQNGEGWDQVATLVGNDTKENDFFGVSVALKGTVGVVGATGAFMGGVFEKQQLHCVATAGHFRLNFRGWQTALINFNVTREGLIDAMISAPGDYPKLSVINAIRIDDWGGGALCNDKRAVITFLSPMHGGTGTDDSHLELLTLSDVRLNSTAGPAILNVTETQRGSIRPNGPAASIETTGAAYVFRTSCLARSCVQTWSQEAQLFPQIATGGARFGQAVATTGTVIVVGAPGSNVEKGNAYIFEYCLNGEASPLKSWNILQQISYDHSEPSLDNFGASLAIDDATIVVGAPSYLDVGAVFVYKRSGGDCGGRKFAIAQILMPNTILFPLAVGDLYGSSVAVSGNFVVVGAPARDAATIYFGKKRNPPQTDTGAAFVFQRTSDADVFLFLQSLDVSNVRRLDRFGAHVAIDNSVIIASSLEQYIGPLSASKAIIEVKTTATYNAVPLGTTFRLLWKASNATGHMAMVPSRDISFDTTALQMKAILEQDLGCIGLLVSRSDIDVYDNGFSWLITFAGQTDDVSILLADTTLLTGTNASVHIQFINRSPSPLRGKAHVFLHTGGAFVEEAFLTPFSQQPVDRCGSSVAISGNYALVGCPNRDSSVPNHNSGATTVYYLSLLHIAFSSSTGTVSEGDSFALTVIRDTVSAAPVDTLFFIETVDRNTNFRKQRFIQTLYGISDAQIGFEQTAADLAGISGTAIARANYYGSLHNESAWVLGMFDYRAISDYVPVYNPHAYLTEYQNLTDFVVTTSDTILEVPDENVTISIHAPGIWPSVLGKLMSVLTIRDDGDGFVNGLNQYDKLYQNKPVAGSHVGHTVSVNDFFGLTVTGCPDGFSVSADGSSSIQTGLALVYGKVLGHHVQKYTLFSPQRVAGGRFGDDVIIRSGYEKNVCIIVVGESNQACVHAYVSYDMGATFVYDATIRATEATLGQDRFGALGTLGMDGNLLVIGAPGLEALFLCIRQYVNGGWSWSVPILLRASDYDYDILYGDIKMHRQSFGVAVAVSGRTVAVGAPFADYDKLGTDLHESDWNTEGSDIFGYGRGKAYVFYSSPAAQLIVLNTPSQLTAGTFRVAYSQFGRSEVTVELPYAVTSGNLKAALEALQSINSVTVTSAAGSLSDGSGYQYSWTVTFMADWQAPGSLTPQWNGTSTSFGCSTCIPFSDYVANPSKQMTAQVIASISDILEIQKLSPSDKRSGARFGSSIALDGDQIIVGSVYSGTITSTSWDFEAGSLAGWGRTGNAFDYQPTFGDNSYLRSVNPDPGYAVREVSAHSNVKGNYYVGTYEKRPGSPVDYSIPDPKYGQGSYAGDGPVGTLTSEVFIIYGTEIQFLIGGGCDIYTEYVELLVDGFSVAKQTGKCRERMESASFNVSQFQNRAAQIRIVDAATSSWGHINVDEFMFDWDVNGGVYINTNNRPVVGGNLETPRSGVVYAFLRHLIASNDLCGVDKLQCEWTEEAKLMASDKRANYFFGASLSVSDSAGIVVIGSPSADSRGFYKEVPSVYPFYNSTGGDMSTLAFPVSSTYADVFQSIPSLVSEASGASGVWYLSDATNFRPDARASQESGAVYVFTKDHAVASNGYVSITQHWAYTEHAKIQAPDISARDNFGASVALDGSIMVIGSTGNDGIQPDAGALYLYQTGFAAVYFATVSLCRCRCVCFCGVMCAQNFSLSTAPSY